LENTGKTPFPDNGQEKVSPDSRKCGSLSAYRYSWLVCIRPYTVHNHANDFNISGNTGDHTPRPVCGYSTLRFPTRFRGDKREVQLTGEAYFDVEKDKRHPFIVKAEVIDVEVLGTRFNIEAYPSDPEIKTTLLEGSVEVSIPGENKQLILSPNESAVYDRAKQCLAHEVNQESDNEITWRNGHFQFDYLPLQEISRQLSHAFNLKIEITDPALRSFRIRANFSNGESLEEILSLLKGAAHFNYTKTNDTIIISSKLN